MAIRAWSTGGRCRPSDRRVPLATAETVLRLFQETYYDLNVRHFREKCTLRAQSRVGATYP